MASYDLEHAKAFFKAKVGFTTGLHEVDGMIKQGEDIVIVDVRLPHDYRQGHLPGAINLPNGQWHKASGLSRENTNVVYCYSQTCHLAAQAALEFLAQGYSVVEMEGGFAGWQASGYAIENGQATVAIELNHTVVPAHDKVASAKFFARILGLPFEEDAVGYFAPVRFPSVREP